MSAKAKQTKANPRKEKPRKTNPTKPKPRKTKIAVLASDRGSNFQSIIDNIESGYIPGKIVLLIVNKEDAGAIERAKKHKIPWKFVDPAEYSTREAYDQKLVDILQAAKSGLICLAGWMRVLSPQFVDAFPNQIINIHPSLLPAFGGGTHAQEDAFTHGVKISGCTVHFVTNDVDEGQIIIQAAVPVLEDDDTGKLSARILKQEHKIYPKAIKMFCEGKLSVAGRHVQITGDTGFIFP